MATSAAERQRAHRERQQQKLARSLRMEGALSAIMKKLEGRPSALAADLRKIAEEGMKT